MRLNRWITSLGPGAYSHKALSRLVMGDELGGGGYGGGAVGGWVRVAAIVEDDVGGSASAEQTVDFAGEAASDGVGRRVFPVGGHCVPQDRNETEAAGDAQNLGATRAVGRTKVADGQASNLLQNLGGAIELIFDCGGGGQCFC